MTKSNEAMGKHILSTTGTASHRAVLGLVQKRQKQILYSQAESLEMAFQLIQSQNDKEMWPFAPIKRLLARSNTDDSFITRIGELWSQRRLEIPRDARALKLVIVNEQIAWSILQHFLSKNDTTTAFHPSIQSEEELLVSTCVQVLSSSPNHLQFLKQAIASTSTMNQPILDSILRNLLQCGHARLVAAFAKRNPETGLLALLECLEVDRALELFWEQQPEDQPSKETYADAMMQGLASHVKLQPMVALHRMVGFIKQVEANWGWEPTLAATSTLVEKFANHNYLNEAESLLDRINCRLGLTVQPSLEAPLNLMVTAYLRAWVKNNGPRPNPERFFQMLLDRQIPPGQEATYWYVRALLLGRRAGNVVWNTQLAHERLLELEQTSQASVGVLSYEVILFKWCQLGYPMHAETMLRRMVDRDLPVSSNHFARVITSWMELMQRHNSHDEAVRRINSLFAIMRTIDSTFLKPTKDVCVPKEKAACSS